MPLRAPRVIPGTGGRSNGQAKLPVPSQACGSFRCESCRSSKGPIVGPFFPIPYRKVPIRRQTLWTGGACTTVRPTAEMIGVNRRQSWRAQRHRSQRRAAALRSAGLLQTTIVLSKRFLASRDKQQARRLPRRRQLPRRRGDAPSQSRDAAVQPSLASSRNSIRSVHTSMPDRPFKEQERSAVALRRRRGYQTGGR